MSRRREVDVGGRRGEVGVGLVAGLSLDLSLDLAEVLLQLPEIIVREQTGMPAVGFRRGHRPLWTIGHACQTSGRAIWYRPWIRA